MGADDSTRSVEENGENEEEPTVVEDVKVKAAIILLTCISKQSREYGCCWFTGAWRHLYASF